MTTTIELDPVFRQALRLLHSSNTDAAESIRKSLDEIIKQRHGSSRMLINTLSKKNLAEESQATGSGVQQLPPSSSSSSSSSNNYRRNSYKSSDSSSNSNSSPVQLSTGATTILSTDLAMQGQEMPMIIALTDSGEITSDHDTNIMLENSNLKEFEECSCEVCRCLDWTAKNRLIECTKCQSLYHQECHSPPILDVDLSDDQEQLWCCSSCEIPPVRDLSSPVEMIEDVTMTMLTSTRRPAKSSSPSSSSSSSSNCVPISNSHSSSKRSSSDHHGNSSSSSSSKSKSSMSKHHVSSSSSSSRSSSSKSNITTPNINIISADKRIQNMKKKAAKSHESKRKHKSSH